MALKGSSRAVCLAVSVSRVVPPQVWAQSDASQVRVTCSSWSSRLPDDLSEVNAVKRLLLLALCGITAVSVGAESPAGDDLWLSRLVGHCLLEGRIAGKNTTHDVDAEWVLNHLYVRLHEVSREKDSRGRAAYEAIVYVTWSAAVGEYAVLWLDTAASGGFAAEGIGRAKPEGESLPFVFKDAHGEVSFKNTFAYARRPTRGSGSWTTWTRASPSRSVASS